jgi:hypothetical protein
MVGRVLCFWERRGDLGTAKPVLAIILSVIVVIVIGSIMTARDAESSDASGIGRYQLVAGCYESTLGQGIIRKDDSVILRGGIFRIDTATGDTWILKEHIDTSSVVEDKHDREWVLID